MSEPQILDQLPALKSDPPKISNADIKRLVFEQYGLQGRFESLVGERDCNSLFYSDTGQKLVVKFSHPAEDPQVLDFQCQALKHIKNRDPQLAVPRIYPTLHGLDFQTVTLENREPVILRAQTCINGRPVPQQQLNSVGLRQAGVLAARLDLALEGFSHLAAHQNLAWDLVNAGQILPCCAAIADREAGELVEATLIHFSNEVKPKLSELRKQVIHADLHFDNLHADPDQAFEINGIVDFGDMLQAPLVIEVSTALADVATLFDDPMPAMAELFAGYESVLPLHTAELAVLQSCIMTRLAITYAIFSWRLVNQGKLSPIYKGFEKCYSKTLTTLQSLQPEQFLAAIKTEI